MNTAVCPRSGPLRRILRSSTNVRDVAQAYDSAVPLRTTRRTELVHRAQVGVGSKVEPG